MLAFLTGLRLEFWNLQSFQLLFNVKLLVQRYLVIFGVVVEIAELLWVKNVVGSGDCSSCLGLGGVLVEVGFG